MSGTPVGQGGVKESGGMSRRLEERLLREELRRERLTKQVAELISSSHLHVFLQSGASTIEHALDVVTSVMKCSDIVDILTDHGCLNLTPILDEDSCSKYPIANGGLGDVFSGQLRDGTSVAIKTIRAYYDPSQSARMYHKRAAKEIYTWSKCRHPNIAQLLGLAVFRECVAMISLWEENGNMLNYLSRHPSADRCQLGKSICAGLVYLHENGIVHGDLKGANVLIAQDGRPMLMDFGNASLLDATLRFTETTTAPGFSLRWTAPELLEGTTLYTKAGDIYALGMTLLEAFTARIPFPDKPEKCLLMHIMIHKHTPTRPEEIIPRKSKSGNVLWEILTRCWSFDPDGRPSAQAVWDILKPLTPDQLEEIRDKPMEGEQVEVAKGEGEGEGELELGNN